MSSQSRRTAALVLASLALLGLLGPLLAPFDPTDQDLGSALRGPSARNWLGTDHLGRDVLSRVLDGARPAMTGSWLALGIAVVIGLPVGISIGYRRGLLDRIVMNVVDGLTALPGLIVVIGILAITGPGLLTSMGAIGVVLSLGFVRIARTVTIAVSGETFVDAARLLGRSRGRIMFDHILPNAAPALLVHASVVLGNALLAEASLGFLGLGAQPPNSSWGTMLAEATSYTNVHPFLAVPPGVAIAAAVLLCQVAGGALARRAAPGEPVSLHPSHPRVVPTLGQVGDADARAETLGGLPTPDAVAVVRGLTIRVAPEAGPALVEGLDLTILPGEIVGLAGTSGSGKTLTGLSLAGLLPAGLTATAECWEGIALAVGVRRGGVAAVLQDPHAGLSPVRTVGSQLVEVARLRLDLGRADAVREAHRLLAAVDLPDRAFQQRAHELSGGMAQRVAIALALIGRPSLVIADEPTTALDVRVQAGILQLFADIRDRFGTAFVVISHDLGVLATISDRVAVMGDGRVLEVAQTAQLVAAPRHPRTIELLRARRALEQRRDSTATNEVCEAVS